MSQANRDEREIISDATDLDYEAKRIMNSGPTPKYELLPYNHNIATKIMKLNQLPHHNWKHVQRIRFLSQGVLHSLPLDYVPETESDRWWL